VILVAVESSWPEAVILAVVESSQSEVENLVTVESSWPEVVILVVVDLWEH
jgi:hypothetical protein